jgi:CheY-like chemotaxis protein
MKQNKGFINVYSEPDKGSTFKLYLPAKNAMLSEPRQQCHFAPRTGDETILVVEDDVSILKIARLILERLGYTVLTASDPGQALQIAQAPGRETIHLLITDVVMPGMNGRELSDRLLRLYPDIKCLFMSGYTANVIAHHGVLEQGVHFINKPFSRQDLSRQVREVLGHENP